MKRPRTVLIPVDFSEPSLEAMSLGSCMANLMEADLVFLSVIPREPRRMRDTSASEKSGLREKLRIRFEAEVEHMNPSPWIDKIEPKYIISEGDAAAEILRVAEEERADLIVIGTHGRRGLARAIMGSVTEQIVRKAECPVLTWRGGVRAPEPPCAAGRGAER